MAEPYVGPTPFRREDSDRFFGREAEVSELLSLVVSNQVVLLYSPSGAGKTSLIEAGLTPRLQEAYEFEVLPVTRVRPLALNGETPPEGANVFMHAALANLELDPRHTTLTDALDSLPHLKTSDGFDAPRAVVFDQLEEIFSVHQESWEHREDFFRQVEHALVADDLLRVVLAIREDHVARLDRYSHIVPGARFRLELLGPAGAERAVAAPVEPTGRRFGKGVAAGLVDELRRFPVEDDSGEEQVVRGEYVEPVQLQVTCEALWRDLPGDVAEITAEHVRAFADVDEVLMRFYDDGIRAAVEATGMDDVRLRTEFERTFITPLGTRGSAYVAGGYAGRIPQAAIEVLEREHVLRAEARARARWFELTHDRLIGPVRKANERAFLETATYAGPTVRAAARVERRGGVAGRLSGRRTESATPAPEPSESPTDDFPAGGKTALCLSGGGYRAMLFNAGALCRLNELGYLQRIDRIAGVSGGAITAALLGLHWPRLEFEHRSGVARNLHEVVVEPLSALAGVTVDVGAVVKRVLGRRGTNSVADVLAARLFGEATLEDLPATGPEIVVTATSLESGQLWRFSKSLMGNGVLGWYHLPRVRLADAVGASSALPPLLSPTVVGVEATPGGSAETSVAPPRRDVQLTDGSLYDSLAVETVWRRFDTVLVSDGRGSRGVAHAEHGWVHHVGDLLAASDNELRALRRRQVATAHATGLKRGTYWSIGSDIASFAATDAIQWPEPDALSLAALPSRLVRLDGDVRRRLIDFGYAVTDAAMRAYVDLDAPPPKRLPSGREVPAGPHLRTDAARV